MTQALGGVIPILPTPFTAQGDVDEGGFANVIEAAISGGADGVAMFGLASEYYKISDTERFHLVDLLVKRVAKRCPVVISVVPHATRLAIKEAVRAVETGADALMVLPPFFLAPATSAILRHIQEVAEAVNVPVIVQYAPLQTGRVIDAASFAELHARVPNLSYVKVDLVPSGPTISDLRSHGLKSLVGYMGLHLPEDFSRGVSGVMPTVSLTPAFVKIWRLLGQNHQLAKRMHQELLPLLNFMMQSVELLIGAEKELLVRRGVLSSAYCRKPAYTLDSRQKDELDAYTIQPMSWLT